MEELCNQILALLHGYVSLQRIERYLQEAEVDDWFMTLKRKEVEEPLNREDDSRVWVKSGTFVWHAGMAQHQPETLESRTEPRPGSPKDIFSLSDISLTFSHYRPYWFRKILFTFCTPRRNGLCIRLTASREREHERFLCWPIPIPRTPHHTR